MFHLWIEFGLLMGISVAVTFLLLRALVLGLLRLFRRLTMGVRRSMYRIRSKVSRRRRRRWRRRRKVKQLIPQFSQIMAEYDESDTPQESARPLTDEEAAEMFVEQVKAILAREASRN